MLFLDVFLVLSLLAHLLDLFLEVVCMSRVSHFLGAGDRAERAERARQ